MNFSTLGGTLAPSVDPSTAQALVKITALLVTGLSVHVSLSPPNPPAPPKLRLAAARKTLFERCVRWVTFCSKVSSSHLVPSTLLSSGAQALRFLTRHALHVALMAFTVDPPRFCDEGVFSARRTAVP